METQHAFGLRALDGAPTGGAAKIAYFLPPPVRDAGTVDALSAFGVPEKDLRHEESAHDVRPPAVLRGLHRAALHGAEAAIRLPSPLLSPALAQRAEPFALRDGVDERAAVAGSVNHEVASIAEHDGVEWVAVGAPADCTDDTIIFLVRFFSATVGLFFRSFFFLSFVTRPQVEVNRGRVERSPYSLFGREADGCCEAG